MTLRAKVLTVAVALALVAGTTAAVVTVRGMHRRDLAERARLAGADAVVAADSDRLLDAIAQARTLGLRSSGAVSRVTARVTTVVVAARRRHAREAARRRAARQAAAEQRLRVAAQPRPSGGLLIGDSVALGAEPCLTPLGYDLDAEVGRQFSTGLHVLERHAADGLPDTVVLHLGTNGPFTGDGFARAMALTGSERRVVWVTIALPNQSQYAFRDGLNQMIRASAAAHDNVRVADFATAAARHPEWFHDDGIHITPAGCEGFTELVDRAVRTP